MNWENVRKHHPGQWVLVEALEAHSELDRRILGELSVLGSFSDSTSAMASYKRLHREQPAREFFVLHTNREVLDIQERRWIGVRSVA